MNFSPGEYSACVKDYEENWSLLDRCLYTLCGKYPHHSCAAEVNTKVWIIARTYATQVERLVPTRSGSMGEALSKVANVIYHHSEQVDALLARLSSVGEPLSDVTLRIVLEVHQHFVDMLKTITKGKEPTSFAAKYLHFHNPCVPIYDGRVSNKIGKIVGRTPRKLRLPRSSDLSYPWYLERFWVLYEHVRLNADLPCSVR